MTENVMRACAPDEPVMVAWREYQRSDDFANSLDWASRTKATTEIVTGALWSAFLHGYRMAVERAAMLHEDINPASDEERHHSVPGAGAMGAVISYRDEIRKLVVRT